MTEELELTKALINFPSVTPAGAQSLDYIQNWLSEKGFSCQRIKGESQSYSVDNLYARYGTKEPVFGFCGHVDVVPPGDETAWSSPPFEAHVRAGKLYGRGAIDMKSGLACFMLAAARFIAENPDFPGSIALLITGDEEAEAQAGTLAILNWMAQQGETLDHCLVGEPSSRKTLGDTIKIGRRGSLNACLTVQGKQGHVAYPHQTHNPIPDLLDLIEALCAKPLDEGSEHFDPSLLQITSIDVGNQACNLIPAQAKATFNVRFNDQWTAQSLIQELQARLVVFTHSYQLDWRVSGEAFFFPPSCFGARVQEAIQAVTGQTATYSTSGGTSDARFISAVCPVAEFGAIGTSLHQVDEYVTLDELAPLSAIYKKLLSLYFIAQ